MSAFHLTICSALRNSECLDPLLTRLTRPPHTPPHRHPDLIGHAGAHVNGIEIDLPSVLSCILVPFVEYPFAENSLRYSRQLTEISWMP